MGEGSNTQDGGRSCSPWESSRCVCSACRCPLLDARSLLSSLWRTLYGGGNNPKLLPSYPLQAMFLGFAYGYDLGVTGTAGPGPMKESP